MLEIRQLSIPHPARQGDSRIILLKQAEQEETNIHHYHTTKILQNYREIQFLDSQSVLIILAGKLFVLFFHKSREIER